MSQDKGEDF